MKAAGLTTEEKCGVVVHETTQCFYQIQSCHQIVVTTAVLGKFMDILDKGTRFDFLTYIQDPVPRVSDLNRPASSNRSFRTFQERCYSSFQAFYD